MRTMTTERGIRTQSLIAVSSTRSAAIVGPLSHRQSGDQIRALFLPVIRFGSKWPNLEVIFVFYNYFVKRPKYKLLGLARELA